MAEIKITKTMVLEAVMAIMDSVEDVVEVNGVEVTPNDIKDYCVSTIEQLAKKADKAKAKAAEKKAAGDTLINDVLSFLEGQTELVTADVITAAMPGEGITKSMVVNRLGKLHSAGKISKEPIKEGSRKVMAYKASPVKE